MKKVYNKIIKCLFLVGEYETRFSPTIKVILPVLTKPLLQHGMEKGIEVNLYIQWLSPRFPPSQYAIEDHFVRTLLKKINIEK